MMEKFKNKGEELKDFFVDFYERHQFYCGWVSACWFIAILGSLMRKYKLIE